jgi:signal transduction histidine kinase
LDIKSKSFSHSIFTKLVVFIIVILCFAGVVTVFLNTVNRQGGDFEAAFEKDYYHSRDFRDDSSRLALTLANLIVEYKSEEHILNGGTIHEEELRAKEDRLYSEFESNYREFDPKLSHKENYQRFAELYAGRIAQIKTKLIQDDLREYQAALQKLGEYPGVYYYASNGTQEFTNSPSLDKAFFKTYPAYLIYDQTEAIGFPPDVNEHLFTYSFSFRQDSLLNPQNDVIYIAFTPQFLDSRSEAWQNNKEIVTNSLKQIGGLSLGLLAALIFLLVITGRKAFGDQEVHLNALDRLYTDFNLCLCALLIGLWAGTISFSLFEQQLYQATFPVTLVIGACGLCLVLSLVRHLKNRTLLKHSLTYTVLAKLFGFLRDLYDSGSIAWKIVLIVIGYPLIVGATFFIFPITIGAAVWLAFKKVQEYQAIRAGLARVREGDLQHKITVTGSGELAKLAEDINRMTEGLNKAVANELKSERLKTELITNVSHDIRTPLTSIITYVDLLKGEKDPDQAAKYLEVIDQKSQRLKILTDDLFEAAKASSGSIPVDLAQIDLISLITQGLGELDDKIQAQQLEFKLNHPPEKVYITADGKLFWRALENLFANIFKYALPGSRVYIEVEDLGESARLVLKNISAAELNIAADALLERFVRGDEARSTQGSGLGLSIAKSLIEMQKGRFELEIDGDLFKVIILMPK